MPMRAETAARFFPRVAKHPLSALFLALLSEWKASRYAVTVNPAVAAIAESARSSGELARSAAT